MNKKESEFPAPLQNILFCITGVAFLYFIVFLDYQGMFVSWKPLDGQLKFRQIITANSLSIQAQTVDNKYYFFRLENFCITQSECNKWIEIKDKANTNNVGRPLIERDVSCSQLKSPMFFREPRGNTIECIHVEGFVIPEMRSIVYYALLDDGNIWVWDFTDSVFRSRGVIVTCLLVLIGGFLFGTIAFTLLKNKRKISNKFEQ